MPLVQHELRKLARRHMGRERPGHTLQATALVSPSRLIPGTRSDSCCRPVDSMAAHWNSFDSTAEAGDHRSPLRDGGLDRG